MNIENEICEAISKFVELNPSRPCNDGNTVMVLNKEAYAELKTDHLKTIGEPELKKEVARYFSDYGNVSIAQGSLPQRIAICELRYSQPPRRTATEVMLKEKKRQMEELTRLFDRIYKVFFP